MEKDSFVQTDSGNNDIHLDEVYEKEYDLCLASVKSMFENKIERLENEVQQLKETAKTETEKAVEKLQKENKDLQEKIYQLQHQVDMYQKAGTSQPHVHVSRPTVTAAEDRTSAAPSEAPTAANISPIASSPAALQTQTVPVQPQSCAVTSVPTLTTGTPMETVMPTTQSQQDIEEMKEGRPMVAKSQKRDITFSDTEDDAPTVKRKKRYRVPIESIPAVLCCASMCLPAVPVAAVVTLRKQVTPLSINELSQWMLDWLWTHHTSTDEKFCFRIGQRKVCLAAFLVAIGMPLSTYYTIKKRYTAGQKVVPKQGGHSRSTSMKSQTALLWLSDYAEKYAEKLTNLAELHLPPCFNKASVYETYVEETEMESEPISMSHFYLLWRNCLNHVNIPKVN